MGDSPHPLIRITGVQVPCTKAKNAFERRVIVTYQFGVRTLNQVQAQITPTLTQGTARELQIFKQSEERIISVLLLNPGFDPQRVNQRISFMASAWVCGDAFIVAKQWAGDLGWVTTDFTKLEWDALVRQLKAVSTPDTPFFDSTLEPSVGEEGPTEQDVPHAPFSPRI